MRAKVALITSLFCLALASSGCMRTSCILPDKREHNLYHDRMKMQISDSLIDHPLNLDEIIEIAMCQNLDLKVKEREVSIQYEVATNEKLNMLPYLMINWEKSERDNDSGSASQSLIEGVPPAPPSISSPRNTQRYDFSFTWNLLDFGISYFRSRQAAHTALEGCYDMERIKQNLVLEITRNYWDTIVAGMAVDETRVIMDHLQKNLYLVEDKVKRKVVSKSLLLDYKDRILQLQLQMRDYSRDYQLALVELKRLMGVTPDREITLAPVTFRDNLIDFDSIDELEIIALRSRPDIILYDVQEFIDVDEARAAFLEAFPGFSLFGSHFRDENYFLLNNEWNIAGLRTTWQLLSAPYMLGRSRIGLKNQLLTRDNRVALSMATLAQVHLAYMIYHIDEEYYRLAADRKTVKVHMLEMAQRKRALGQYDEADVLTYQIDALDAHIRANRAYADLQVTLEQLNNAIGVPRYYKNENEVAG